MSDHMTDKPRIAPPRSIDEGLLLALSRDAGNLIHDANEMASRYKRACREGKRWAGIWEQGIRMLLRTRDVEATRKWLRTEFKEANVYVEGL